MEIWHTLTGQIENKAVQESIRWINDELYSKPVTRLRFLLASGGGEINAGIAMHAYLKALPIQVETIGFGEVDAAAIPIYLAGKHRFAVIGCQFFFHEGRYTFLDPTAPIHAHEETIAMFKRELRTMMLIIARETGNDMDLVSNMLRRSKSMVADEAKEFGLCHEIITELPLVQQEQIGFRAEK